MVAYDQKKVKGIKTARSKIIAISVIVAWSEFADPRRGVVEMGGCNVVGGSWGVPGMHTGCRRERIVKYNQPYSLQ